ncbi:MULTISPECIES: hypothetical protein [Streptomyces]|uniref:hypothetical protein n=1 Tax=Streptomyces TaxID=1883 RepID=UPI0018F0C0B5|nr:hypothetical protein [Streptomyces sp. CRPSP2-6A1]MBJ7005324.1 hypothetical protein [Streptomyces sp. CRPSP2-6A1]
MERAPDLAALVAAERRESANVFEELTPRSGARPASAPTGSPTGTRAPTRTGLDITVALDLDRRVPPRQRPVAGSG